MIINSSKLIIVFVDIQEKLTYKIFDYKKIIDYVLKVIDIAKSFKIPVVLTEQYPKGLGKTILKITESLNELDLKKIEKTTFSCQASNDFRKHLKRKKRSQVLICGIETHICILQTVHDLIKSKYNVFILDEATGSRKLIDKELGIKRLKQMGSSLINFEMLLFELIRDSKNPNFKNLSKLIDK